MLVPWDREVGMDIRAIEEAELCWWDLVIDEFGIDMSTCFFSK